MDELADINKTITKEKEDIIHLQNKLKKLCVEYEDISNIYIEILKKTYNYEY